MSLYERLKQEQELPKEFQVPTIMCLASEPDTWIIHVQHYEKETGGCTGFSGPFVVPESDILELAEFHDTNPTVPWTMVLEPYRDVV
jgi:hypothetical protein